MKNSSHRLKDILVRRIYALLELLPERLSAKLKILGNVLVHDWRMNAFGYPDYFFEFRELTPPEITGRLEGLDARSIAAVHRYIALQQLCYTDQPNRLFYNWTGFISSAERRQGERQMRQLRRLRRRHGLSRCDSASLVHHHGMKTLSPPQLERVRGRIFIDAGACAGDSTLAFLPYAPSKILAFEPSPSNRAEFQATMRRNRVGTDRYELIGEGLSASEGEVAFEDLGDGTNRLTGAGSVRVRVRPLDTWAHEREAEIGVIKADVEGMGLELVRGAIETIRKDLPILSIGIYHNRQELFGVYELLRSLELPYDYRILSLCFPWENFDLTLLAVPRV
jgi:FkbM family methyltransferase